LQVALRKYNTQLTLDSQQNAGSEESNLSPTKKTRTWQICECNQWS